MSLQGILELLFPSLRDGSGDSNNGTNSSSSSKEEDLIGGEPLPNCPDDDTDLWGVFHHPTVLFTEIVLGLVCVVGIAVIAAKYNSVRVFNRKIRTPPISNTLWIVYFAALALRALFDAFRYGLDVTDKEDDLQNLGFYLSSLVMTGISVLLLSLSLNHQKKYRSPGGATTQTSKQETHAASEAPPSKAEIFRSLVFARENVYFLLFALYLVFLYLETSEEDDKHGAFFWCFVAFCLLQYLPVIVLTLLIVSAHSNNDGPTKLSKNLLFFGTLLNMSLVFPPTIWAYWLPSECYLYFASLVDVLQWLHIASLVLYFVFIREEYQRNMEECIWTTVSQIQDTFDFRRF